MTDPREYGFWDWYLLFSRAVPAFLLATLMVVAPLAALAALAVLSWFLVPVGRG